MFNFKSKKLALFSIFFAVLGVLINTQTANAFNSNKISDHVRAYSYYQALLASNPNCIGDNMRSVITRTTGHTDSAPDENDTAGNEGPTWFGSKKEIYVWPRSKATCATVLKNYIDLMGGGYSNFLKAMNGRLWDAGDDLDTNKGTKVSTPTWIIFAAGTNIYSDVGLTQARRHQNVAGGTARTERFKDAVKNSWSTPVLSNAAKYYAYLASLNNSAICNARSIPQSKEGDLLKYANTNNPVDPSTDVSGGISGTTGKSGVSIFYTIPTYDQNGNKIRDVLYEVRSTTTTTTVNSSAGSNSTSQEDINAMWSGENGSISCVDMAKALSTNSGIQSAWQNWIRQHPDDATDPALNPEIVESPENLTNRSADDANDTEEGEKTCQIEGIGWIVCPVVTFMANMSDSIGEHLGNYLNFPASILTDDEDTSVRHYWGIMRDYANVLLVIAFLVIIYSQLTGFGMSNYGIKSMLPKLVICVLLINVSFYICGILVDVSNLVGASAFNFISNGGTIGEGATGAFSTGDNNLFTSIAGKILVGVTAAAGAIWLGLGTLIAGLISVILIGLTTVILLGARQAIMIMIIVISPLAFAAMLLPNTEGLFKKWWQVFKTMLFLYPTIGALYGAAQLASNVINSTYNTSEDGLTWTVQIIGAVLGFLPLLLVPTVVKKAMDIGNISNLVGRFQSRADKGARNFIDNNAFTKHRREVAARRSAMIKGGTYTGRGGRWNPRNIRSNLNERFNRSKFSGDFGDKRSMAGVYAESQESQERLKMAAAVVENMTDEQKKEVAKTGMVNGQYSSYHQRAALEQVSGLWTASEADKLAETLASDKFRYNPNDDPGKAAEKAAVRQAGANSISKNGKASHITGPQLGKIVAGGVDGKKLYNSNEAKLDYIKKKMSAESTANMDAEELKMLNEIAKESKDREALEKLDSYRNQVLESSRLDAKATGALKTNMGDILDREGIDRLLNTEGNVAQRGPETSTTDNTLNISHGDDSARPGGN